MKPLVKRHQMRLSLDTEYYLKWDAYCGSYNTSNKLMQVIDMLERQGQIPGYEAGTDEIKTIFNSDNK